MPMNRRRALGLGLAASANALVFSHTNANANSHTPSLAGDSYSFSQNQIIVHPINHASLVLSINDTIIYVDPVGPMGRYQGLPPADLILVTHHHDDHFDKSVLSKLGETGAPLITNSVVDSSLPTVLKSQSTSLKNGDFATHNNIQIEAIPAYNTTSDRIQYHPEGRDNGYILNLNNARIYLAGDTEDIPEMRALKAIDLAFIPMILPWTMDVTQAASAAGDFAPETVYPYHYGTSDVDQFKTLVDAQNQPINVQLAKWY